MNDPMNNDPLDRELDQLLGRAFASRPDGPVSTPSMLDVRHRARLRHRRRAGAMLGSVALVGAGGVAVLAKSGDGADRVSTPGAGTDDGLGLPSTTALCTPVTTAFLDPGQFATTTITVLAGNAGDAGVDTTALNDAATSTTVAGIDPGLVPTTLPPYDCSQNGSVVWSCTGNIGPDGQGRELFTECVPVDPNGSPLVTETTSVCLDGSSSGCLPQTTVVPTTACGPTDDCGATTDTVPPFGTYVLQQGDTKAVVASMFNVSVADLDAANAGDPDYDNFVVGTVIVIPPTRVIGTTTMPPDLGGVSSTFVGTTTTLAGG